MWGVDRGSAALARETGRKGDRNMHNSHAQHSHRRRWQPSGLASRVAIYVPIGRRPTRSRLFQEPHQSWLLPRAMHTAGGTQGLDSADRENWGTSPELALGTGERAGSGATRGLGISADVGSDVRTKNRLGQTGTRRSILDNSS